MVGGTNLEPNGLDASRLAALSDGESHDPPDKAPLVCQRGREKVCQFTALAWERR